MKTNHSFEKQALKIKLNEVYFIEPNNLGIGFLTGTYKNLTRFLKTMPFIVILPLSLLVAFLLYLVLGYLLVKLVTLLQYGF